jgi:hypothetical protein
MSYYIDPTYLRYIYDGLQSGAVHKDNVSSLPEGLIGMYEEALPPESNLKVRNKFLEFFGVWALMKKEVSAWFLAPLLEGWTEEQIATEINEYSKWFNAPVSGKFIIYHERFRAFLLAKNTLNQLTVINNRIINTCRRAIKLKGADEWEHYALEYLSSHLFFHAILDKNNITALKELCCDTNFWNRQVQLSKGYEWSNKMLYEMMIWTLKHDEKEMILCAQNRVELHRIEQNDAPRIIDLVTQNEIDIAIQRIEAYAGNDREGLQRKFILYMLCLLELTLFDSKSKEFKKPAIESLLSAMSYSGMTNNLESLNWITFFPEIIILNLICEWELLSINYEIIFQTSSRPDDKCFQYSVNKLFIEEKSNLREFINSNRNSLRKLKHTYFEEIITMLESIDAEPSVSDDRPVIKLGLASLYNLDHIENLIENEEFDSAKAELENIGPEVRIGYLFELMAFKDNVHSNWLKQYIVETFNNMRFYNQLICLNELSVLYSNEAVSEVHAEMRTLVFGEPWTDNWLMNIVDLYPHVNLQKYILTRMWLRNKNISRTFLYEMLTKLNDTRIVEENNDSVILSLPIEIVINQKKIPNCFQSRNSAYSIGYEVGKINNVSLLQKTLNHNDLVDYKSDILNGFATSYQGADIQKAFSQLFFIFFECPKHLEKWIKMYRATTSS